ncbi:MAG: hypothetical protein IJ601_12635 [Acidaminococcaceae bacterium]|nr:hypothetical protein [Acidaminococcaceae bacterium]
MQAVQAQLDEVTNAAQQLQAAMQDITSPSVSVQQPEMNVQGVDVPVTSSMQGSAPQLDLPESAEIPITPVMGEIPQIDLPQGAEIPINTIVGDQPQIDAPESIEVPVTPEITQQPQIQPPDEITVPVIPLVDTQPQIDVPQGLDVPVTPIVTEQPQINAPDGVEVPITPIVTDQPQIDAPGEITVPVDPVVTGQPQIDVPESIDIPVNVDTPGLDTGSVGAYQDQIQALASLLQQIVNIQQTISAQGNNISILPDDAREKIASVNADIAKMEAALSQIQENPFNLDAEATRLQIVELNNSILQTAQSQRELNAQMQGLQLPPLEWKSDTFKVFTNSGIERFQSEIQSANAMLNTLNSTQARIAQTAASTTLFPPNMVNDMTGMQNRLQAIQQRIEQIENNPINMGSDAANRELEQLRGQLDQAVELQQALNNAVDNLDITAANDAYLRLSNTIQGTEQYIRDNVDEQGQFNNAIREGADAASDLQSLISKALGAFGAIVGINSIKGFISQTTSLFDTQLNAETQLMSVLSNMLDADYVAQFEIETTADTTDAIAEINAIQDNIDAVSVPVSAETKALTAAFDTITNKAAEIQSRGIYGDEAMIAGAAEFATYFSDTDAITSMMDTLADYAMGMSGGGALDASAMVDYATNLGKIMSGSYDAMTKKGFEFSDVQKSIIEGEATRQQIIDTLGAEYADMSQEMQAAATISQIIDEAWDGLYENMSNTPQGKIIQMTNAWGDMQEVIGGRLYPYVILFVDAINNNWPTIETIVNGITTALQFMLGVLSWLLDAAIAVAQGIIDHWGIIGPVIGAVTAALIAYGTYLAITKALEIGAAAIKGALVIAEYAHAAATGAEVAATTAATAAQMGFNTALLACPITWIIVLVIALVALLYVIIGAINEIAGTTISATGIIMGALATIGAYILNIFILAWNIVAAFIEFLVNVWKNPEFAIKAFAVNVAVAFLNFCLACVSGTQSAVGVIVGLWYAFLQAVHNVVAAVYNVFMTCVEAVVNGWNNGVYQVKSFLISIATAALSVAQSVASSMGSTASAIANAFISAANTAIGAINSIIGALNNIPGVNIGTISEIGAVSWDFGASAIADTSASLQGLLGDAPDAWAAPQMDFGSIGDAYDAGKTAGADMVSGMESALSGTIANLEASVAEKPADYWEAPTFDYINLSDAAAAGYEFGEGIDNAVSNFDPASLFGATDIPSAEDYANAMAGDMGGIGDGVDDIAGSAGSIADELSSADEELKYLRDIAEQEAINRFTTAEIHVDMSGMQNTVNSNMDLDGVVSYLSDAVTEALAVSAEGVHI